MSHGEALSFGGGILEMPMKRKIIAAYMCLKGFSKYRTMAFSFSENLFSQGKKLFFIPLVHWMSKIQILVVRKLISLIQNL